MSGNDNVAMTEQGGVHDFFSNISQSCDFGKA